MTLRIKLKISQFDDLKKRNHKFKLLFLIISFFMTSCCGEFCKREKYAQEIIQKTENFKQEKGYYPKDLSEIGLMETEDSKAYYIKVSDNEFEVWYAIGFESKIYNSKTKKWKEEG